MKIWGEGQNSTDTEEKVTSSMSTKKDLIQSKKGKLSEMYMEMWNLYLSINTFLIIIKKQSICI